MNVGFDGKRFFKNTSGLGRYSRTLIKGLLQLPQDNNFKITLFRPKGEVRFQPPTDQRLRVVQAHYVLPGDLGNGLWRFLRLPAVIEQEKCTLFHGPSHVIPPKITCPTVVTMFDLIFLRYPAYFRRWDRTYYRVSFRKSARTADHIISISESTKADLIAFFEIDPAKITVIYPGFDDVFQPLDEPMLANIRRKYDLPQQYILYVGTIEPRKNVLGLAKAFDTISASGAISSECYLLIAGQKGWFYDDVFKGIDRLQTKSKIRFLGPVYGRELAGLYQGATVMAYPSLYEGFGYPVIEAMSLHVPVLTSRTSSLLEAGGDAAHLVDPLDLDEIGHGLTRIINDHEYRQALVDRGTRHVTRFSPQNMAQQTFALYQKISDCSTP
ncbi:glycosyltransferase family 4 protein [bacterium]|nr:glycosyltransferase family 4 protein [bacterium]